MNYFAHPAALVESAHIGAGTRVWAFAHILPGAVVGTDCNICDGVFIENDVTVGDRVTVKCGVQLWDGVTLADDVFVGPNATFTNDRHPRSRQRPAEPLRTVVERGASIGANATVLPGITIGAGAMVGAGAVVTRDVPAGATVVGNPARIMGRGASDARRPASGDSTQGASPKRVPIGIRGAALFQLDTFADERGTLRVGEIGGALPFVPRRMFTISEVPPGARRGGHAHRLAYELLVCARGACSVDLDDGVGQRTVRLDDPALGLLVPPDVWRVLHDHTTDVLLVVLASEPYEPADYVHEYAAFVAARRE